MKTSLTHTLMAALHLFFRTNVRNPLGLLVTVLLGSPALLAQQQNFEIISDRSTASLYLGSRNNPTSYNAGVARVSGNALLDSDDPGSSRFNFTIYAAGENPPSADSRTASGDQPAISFHSEKVKTRSDGTLEARGQLTLLQPERQVTTSTGEDYAGPVYGPATVVETSHEATFILAGAQAQAPPETSSGDAHALTIQKNQPQPAMSMLATTSVSSEDFPELSRSVRDTVWPLLVNDEQCSAPLTVGDDYSGGTCTGEVIEPAAAALIPTQTGEDYAGLQLVPPAGDQVTIHLELALSNTGHSSSIGGQNSNGKFKTNSQSPAGQQ